MITTLLSAIKSNETTPPPYPTQHVFIKKPRSESVLADLVLRTKNAVREIDNRVGSRFKKLLVESNDNNDECLMVADDVNVSFLRILFICINLYI